MRQEKEIESRVDAILDGKDPERPDMPIEASAEVLEQSSTKELERLLADPALMEPQNDILRDQVMRVLREREGASKVNELVESLRDTGAPQIQQAATESLRRTDLSVAEYARQKLAEFNCPLAEVLPFHVEEFAMDSGGYFYMRLDQVEPIHMADFDLMLDEEISGYMEADVLSNLAGVSALAQVNQDVLQINFTEMLVDGDDITITTDHPVARLVHLKRDDFLFAVLSTFRA